MKAVLVALAASSLLSGAAASHHARHAQFHAKKDAMMAVVERGADAANATCDCEIKTTTIYGEMTSTWRIL